MSPVACPASTCRTNTATTHRLLPGGDPELCHRLSTQTGHRPVLAMRHPIEQHIRVAWRCLPLLFHPRLAGQTLQPPTGFSPICFEPCHRPALDARSEWPGGVPPPLFHPRRAGETLQPAAGFSPVISRHGTGRPRHTQLVVVQLPRLSPTCWAVQPRLAGRTLQPPTGFSPICFESCHRVSTQGVCRAETKVLGRAPLLSPPLPPLAVHPRPAAQTMQAPTGFSPVALESCHRLSKHVVCRAAL